MRLPVLFRDVVFVFLIIVHHRQAANSTFPEICEIILTGDWFGTVTGFMIKSLSCASLLFSGDIVEGAMTNREACEIIT